MEYSLAKDLSDLIVLNNSKMNMVIAELKDKYPESVYKPYLEKLAHMMALSFDVLDMLGHDYPSLNPYADENDGVH